MKKYKLATAHGPVQVTLKKHHWAKRLTAKVVSREEVLVTIPQRTPYRIGQQFIQGKLGWVERHVVSAPIQHQPPTNSQRSAARECITNRVDHWAELMRLEYGRISIRNQRTRWGSCSGSNNLNFNWRLSKLPQELLDYVVVHELVHIIHRNHSRDFYHALAAILPDYKNRQQLLGKYSLAGGIHE